MTCFVSWKRTWGRKRTPSHEEGAIRIKCLSEDSRPGSLRSILSRVAVRRKVTGTCGMREDAVSATNGKARDVPGCPAVCELPLLAFRIGSSLRIQEAAHLGGLLH